MERNSRFSGAFRLVQAAVPFVLLIPFAFSAWLMWSTRRVERVPVQASQPIARWVPSVDARDAVRIEIAAPPAVVWNRLWSTDWRSGAALEAALIMREIPRHVRVGDSPVERPQRVTLDTLIAHGILTILEGEPGRRVVFGSIGRPWQGDWGTRVVDRDSFPRFRESEHVRMVWSLEVSPAPGHASMLTLEWRSEPIDEKARGAFERYWTVARPVVTLLARAGLHRYAQEVEDDGAGHDRATAAVPATEVTSSASGR